MAVLESKMAAMHASMEGLAAIQSKMARMEENMAAMAAMAAKEKQQHQQQQQQQQQQLQQQLQQQQQQQQQSTPRGGFSQDRQSPRFGRRAQTPPAAQQHGSPGRSTEGLYSRDTGRGNSREGGGRGRPAPLLVGDSLEQGGATPARQQASAVVPGHRARFYRT